MLPLTITGWLDRREREVLAYLIEENRLLRRRVGGRRLRLTDDDRRKTCRARLSTGPPDAARACDDRHAGHVAPLAPAAYPPQMDLRQAGQESSRCSGSNPPVGPADAEENPRWGYTRIQGPSRTSDTVLAGQRLHGSCERTGVRPHRSVCHRGRRSCGRTWVRSPTADFFTTKVWTRQGLVTVYAVFVIELTARRVQVLGSTAHPDQAFMLQIVRDLTLTNAARVRC